VTDQKSDALTVLNYLDGIAIGVEQRLYVEELANDHLQPIVKSHLNEIIIKRPTLVNKADFDRVCALNERWQKNPISFRA
jgi:hypothetical protein